jgi:branched-chain amino acid transport system permease protein
LSLDGIVQNLVFGLFVGSNYGIAAVGLSLVFGVLKVLNVAHGELLMLGGYLSYWLFTLAGVDPFLSLGLCVPALFLLGLALHRGLFHYVEQLDEEARIKNSLLISFGLALIVQNVALTLWTADERSITTGYSGSGVSLFGVVLPFTRMAGLVAGLLVIVALHLLLYRTYFGKAVRATTEDWEAAELAGIDVRRTYLVTFALGAALAGLAGALVSVGYSIAPAVGLAWTLKALVVVVLAGLGSVFGTFVAGLLLGVVEALSVLAIGAPYREVVGLSMFLAVLLLRPRGLFGRR